MDQQRLSRIIGKITLHKNEVRTVAHRVTASLKDCNRLIVLPVVNDITKYVGVTTCRHSFEEVLPNELAAITHAGIIDELPRIIDDVRQVEKDPTQVRMALEDRGEQSSPSRPNIATITLICEKSYIVAIRRAWAGEFPSMPELNKLATSGCAAM
jgi:hypothetical protein